MKKIINAIVRLIDAKRDAVTRRSKAREQKLKDMTEKCYCLHNWRVHYEKDFVDRYDRTRVTGIEQILICQKCGEIKKISL